jgi:adenosylcobinamide hydrolase
VIAAELLEHTSCGGARPALVWRFSPHLRIASSASVGGGIGEGSWIINAQVPLKYARVDLAAHALELSTELRCTGAGVTMLTAAAIGPPVPYEDGGVVSWATVGITKPTWAAAPDGAFSPPQPGTINVVVAVPVRLTDSPAQRRRDGDRGEVAGAVRARGAWYRNSERRHLRRLPAGR